MASDEFSYLGGRRVKKAATKARKTTIGRVAPVPRPKNPYYPPSGPNKAQSEARLLGLLAQQRGAEKPMPTTALAPSYDADPILAKIRALGSQTVANAESEAARLRKQAVIDAGVTEGNLGVDQSTLQAAGSNPASAVAQLRFQAQQRERELEEALNQQNLFYGGYRGEQLTDLARNRALGEAQIGQSLFGALSEIDTGVAQSRAAQVAEEQRALAEAAAAAQQQAYMDSLMAALAGAGTAPQAVATPPVGYENTITGNDFTPEAYQAATGVTQPDYMSGWIGGPTDTSPVIPQVQPLTPEELSLMAQLAGVNTQPQQDRTLSYQAPAPEPTPALPPPDPAPPQLVYWPGYGWMPIGWNPPVGAGPGMQ